MRAGKLSFSAFKGRKKVSENKKNFLTQFVVRKGEEMKLRSEEASVNGFV